MYLTLENTVIKYTTESAPILHEDHIDFGEFLDYSLNSSSAVVVNTAATKPVDWIGNKYLWVDDNFVINPSYIDPNPPAPLPVPESITYRQFILGLLAASFITQEEALAAASGTIPACIDDVFDTLPVEDAVKAKITFKTMTSVYRSDPIVTAAGTALGQTSEDIDDFFRLSSTL